MSDLVLGEESDEKFKERVQKWKASMEAKGQRINVGETKVILRGKRTRRVEETGNWPCGVSGEIVFSAQPV